MGGRVDPASISTLILGLLMALAAAGQWLDARHRKRRARDRATIERQDRIIEHMSEWGDSALDALYRSQAMKRRHNAEIHPDGRSEVLVTEIPAVLTAGIRAIRAEVEKEADDDD